MKNNYRDEAEILIWNQGLSIGRIPFPGAAPGHAALELRSEQKPNDRCFISWWPGGDTVNPFARQAIFRQYNRQDAKSAEMGDTAHRLLDPFGSIQAAMDAQVSPRPGQKPLRNTPGWGQTAHKKIRLPLAGTIRSGAGKSPAFFGVHGCEVRRWFQRELADNPQYQFASSTHNCSGVVTRALIAGGASAVCEPPSNFVCSPEMARSWAEELLREFTLLNGQFNGSYAVALSFKQRNPTVANLLGPEKQYADLMEAAYFGRGVVALPDGEAEIKKALADYHAAPPWDAPWRERPIPRRMTALVRLARLIVTYVTNRTPERVARHEFVLVLLILHQIRQKLVAIGTPPY